ncbi:MAG: hypothetical protein ACXQTS_05690 [Candidatus Methanospirareceae archaeon]
MPAKKYHVYLSDEEREYLERFVEDRSGALNEKTRPVKTKAYGKR